MSGKEKDPRQEQRFEQTVKRMFAAPPKSKSICENNGAKVSNKADYEQKLIPPNE